MARLLVAAILLAGTVVPSSAEIRLVDVQGREVVLDKPAERILLEVPAAYTAFELMSDKADQLIVGVGGTQSWALSEAEQELADKPRLGWMINQTFSVEKALALKPDLLVAGSTAVPSQQLAVEQAFAKAGIPVVYIDFFLDPERNSIPSLQVIGKAIGRETEANAYIAFHKEHERRIIDRRTQAAQTNRTVFFATPNATQPCCMTFATQGLRSQLEALGAQNIAEGKFQGPRGQLSLEYVLSSNPDLVLVLDSGDGANPIFGKARSPDYSATSLEKLRDDRRFTSLAAVRNGSLHALDSTFIRTPLNILTLEAMASWIHPDLFADIDPQATLNEINARFLKAPLKGPFWTSVRKAPTQPTEVKE